MQIWAFKSPKSRYLKFLIVFNTYLKLKTMLRNRQLFALTHDFFCNAKFLASSS